MPRMPDDPPRALGAFLLRGALIFCTLATPAFAADYYAGKSIDFLVGAPPGGGYDIYARLVARHLGKHIPGNPNVIVKNMPGAGSAKAAQYIATIAPKDGTAVAGIMPGAIMGPLLDDRTAPLFDPTKVMYVGTANNGVRICVTLKGFKLSRHVRRRQARSRRSSAAAGRTTRPTSTATCTATPRARCGMSSPAIAARRRWRSPWSGARSTASAAGTGRASSRRSQRNWLRDDKRQHRCAAGRASRRIRQLQAKMGVPSILTLVKGEEERKVVELVISQTVFHRSYIAPPGTPPEQLGVLRKAFDETVADKEFLADAERVSVDIDPLPGAKVQEVVSRLYATPPDIVKKREQADQLNSSRVPGAAQRARRR